MRCPLHQHLEQSYIEPSPDGDKSSVNIETQVTGMAMFRLAAE